MTREQQHTTVDGAGMRARNSSLLLNMIWRERQISRADIARRTGLSPSTVSSIVSELQHSGLVRDIGAGISRGGRRPTLLGFCDDAFAIVGIDVGSSHVTTVLTDLRGQVRATRQTSHPVREDPAGTLSLLTDFVTDCLRETRVPRRRVVGIGVGVPSPVHPSAPGRLLPLVMPQWRDTDVRAELARAFEVPVLVENDANVGALAESWWGAGQDGQDLTFIKLGTGVGAGYIINGHLYRGAGGTAGEMGHLALDPSGPPCFCGLRGCLHALIGAQALANRAAELGLTGAAGAPTLDDILTGARSGDAAARKVFDEAGHYLGVAVAGLLNLINPAVVVLGGKTAAVGDLLLEPLRATLRARALSTSVAETRIVTSTLGNIGVAIGAATLVLQAVLADQTLFQRTTRETFSYPRGIHLPQ